MNFRANEVVNVKYCCGDEIIKVGKIATANRKIFFEYDDQFLKTKFELSPFKLPLRSGIIGCDDRVFDGIFGIFNDSLPDGWGRLLLDRKLNTIGINPMDITPLDRLCYVGKNGMGALMYEPEIKDAHKSDILKDLDFIADECYNIQEDNNDEFIDDLLAINGSSAGARPKIIVSILQNGEMENTKSNPKTSHDNWIIKFRSSTDPKDIGCIEYAYHLMAQEAGLEVPEAKIFKSKKCSGYFGVKRFDRQKSSFMHMHTISGLLHIDHRVPTLDYEILLKATLHLTKDISQCEKQFRHMVFNIFSHNRDDHAKNFSFLMDKNGTWTVSPAYDLTFSAGPMGQHCTTLLGEGKSPSMSHMLKIAEIISIKEKRALEIIDQVRNAIFKWDNFADEAHVSKKSTKAIKSVINAKKI